MKKLNQFIMEKLKLSKNNDSIDFTDEELRNDYKELRFAYTKAEKEPFKEKYAVNSNKIRDIQIEILNILREHRNNKKQFTKEDITDFLRFDPPERYENYIKYLEQETNKFIEYLLSSYEERAKKIHPTRQSISDRYTLKKISYLKKYLGHQ